MRQPHRFAVAAVALSALVLTATSCAQPVRAGLPEITPGAEATVHAGSAVRIAGTGITILVERIDDSRCPSDVTCVRAGEARVLLSLRGAEAAASVTLELVVEPPTTRYGGYVITLVDVRPYPRSTDRDRAAGAVLRVTITE